MHGNILKTAITPTINSGFLSPSRRGSERQEHRQGKEKQQEPLLENKAGSKKIIH